jgi:hypothetical protein
LMGCCHGAPDANSRGIDGAVILSCATRCFIGRPQEPRV